MRENVWKQAEQFRDANRRRKRLYRGIGVLGCVAVLCTVSALMKPAITQEKYSCGLEEHTHTEACYGSKTVEKIRLNCTEDLHVHEDSCWDQKKENLICGYEDFYIHEHDESCYIDGELVCALPEIEEHTHNSSCYSTSLSCGQQETEAHSHTDSCYTETLTCDTEEENHTHTETCYTRTLTCGQEETEGHSHTDSCYTATLICKKPVAILHEKHTDSCYDKDDKTKLTCTLPILQKHTHTDSCQETYEVQETVLVCGQEEHTHTSSCTDSQLICGQEESELHTHDSSCYAAADFSALWEEMTDEEFVTWITCGDHDAYLKKVYEDDQNGESTLWDGLLARMDAIFENTEDTETATTYYSEIETYLNVLWGIEEAEASTLATTPDGTKLTSSNITKYIDYTNKTFVLRAGTYYLGENIDLGSLSMYVTTGQGRESKNVTYLRIDGTVTLDLNGHVLKGTGDYCVINVESGTLKIKDSDPDNAHYGSVDTNTNLWTWNGNDNKTGDIEIDGGIITGGGSSTSSTYVTRNSGIAVWKNGTLNMTGGTVAGNKECNDKNAGAGISCYGEMTLENVRICYNYATHNGGGAYASGEVTLTSVQIDHNHADDYGGGIRVSTQYDTTFKMESSTVAYNTANIDGGGIEFSMGHDGSASQATKVITASFTDVTIEYNTAKTGTGGGISMSQQSNKSATLTIEGSKTTINNNTAAKNGGGIYLEYGTVFMNDGTITQNTATQYGGGITVSSGSTQSGVAFIMSGGTIENNTATIDGGGAYVSGGNVAMSGGTVKENHAANGVGIAVSGGDFTMTGGSVEKNTTTTGDGGGAYVTGGNVVMSGGTVQENGAVNGAGLAINGGDFTMGDTKAETTPEITGNIATRKGGGIAIKTGTFTMQTGTVQENQATMEGGGAFVSGGTVVMKNGTICKNTSSADGGGLAVDDSAQKGTVSLYDGTFQENTAVNGGGIRIIDGDFTMYGGTVSGNQAIGSNDTQGTGGGGYVTGGNVNLAGGTFTGNTARLNGGGLAVEGESTDALKLIAGAVASAADLDEDLEDSETTVETTIEIRNNTATQGNGGGIYLNDVDFELYDANISGNEAVNWNLLNSTECGNGGGIYIKNAIFTMYGGIVSENKCTRFGGGVYIWSPSTDSTLSGGTISGNLAAQCGGGLAIYQCEATLDQEVDIESNAATLGGGVYVRWDANLDMDGGTIAGNHAHSMGADSHSGEIGGDFFERISAIWNNNHNATSMNFAESNTESNPDYGGDGGGVFLINSSFSLSGGAISGNSAARNGGGVLAAHTVSTLGSTGASNDSATTLTIENGQISNNTAEKHGGGVCIATYDWRYDGGGGDGKLQSEGCAFTDNNAACAVEFTGAVVVGDNTAENGGGFYVGGGLLRITGGFIRENNAVGTPSASVTTAYDSNQNVGVGGGIYVYHAGRLQLAVEKGSIGIYSNLADYAADDVFCSPATNSDLTLPAVSSMVLTDYRNHRIGKAEAWFEDYHTGDTKYNDRDTNGVDAAYQVLENLSKIQRYRDAQAIIEEDPKATVRKVEYRVADKTSDVDGYVCLTLGYSYTRANLTITKELLNAKGEEMDSAGTFTFRVKITGVVDHADESYTDGYNHVYQETDQNYKVVEEVHDTYDSDGTLLEKGYAIVEFSLDTKDNRSVTLEGIPLDSEVVITETKADGFSPSFQHGEKTISGNTCTLTVSEDTSITCINRTGYELPSTGGSGTLIFTVSGLSLVAFAVVCWKRRRRAVR